MHQPTWGSHPDPNPGIHQGMLPATHVRMHGLQNLMQVSIDLNFGHRTPCARSKVAIYLLRNPNALAHGQTAEYSNL